MVDNKIRIIYQSLTKNPVTKRGFLFIDIRRLLLCNIAIMKRFVPLLVLTGLLFGQDVLILKSGESYNGKLRGNIQVSVDIDDKTLKSDACQIESVKKYLDGKDIIKKIIVPGRLVNFVIK